MSVVPQEKVDEAKRRIDDLGVEFYAKKSGNYGHWGHAVLAFVLRTLAWLARVLSFGFAEVYYDNFYTTIGRTIYYPSDAPDPLENLDKLNVYRIIRHEVAHVYDWMDYPVWFRLSYVLILPLFWTMRAFWEYRGYGHGMVALYEVLGHIPDWYVSSKSKYFTNPYYGWMAPFNGRENLLRVKEAIEREEITGWRPSENEWKGVLKGEIALGV